MSRTAALLKELDVVTTGDDQLLFLGDGCYQLSRCAVKGKVFASEADMTARGLTYSDSSLNIESLTDEQWTALIAAADKTVSW